MVEPVEFYPSHSPMQQIASDFRRWGWLGFWLQIVFGAVPLLMLFATLFFAPAQLTNRSLPWWSYLAYLCPFALIFTIYWFYRYTILSQKLLDPHIRPPKSEVIRSLRLGLIVNLIGMGFAIIVSLGQVTTLWVRMSMLPPGASTITTSTPGTVVMNQGAMVLPLQMMGIMAMVCTIAAGWIGIFISLALLYRVNQHRNSTSNL